MKTTITYLFDPLCGWCYGATPAIQQLGRQEEFVLELAPTGLFAGHAGRIMDAVFADYAWTNDMRIEKFTGQGFSKEYQTHILGKHGSRFDSAAATLALTAVFLTTPERESEALNMLQEARYIHAQDTCNFTVVTTLLRTAGFVAASELMLSNDATLQEANHGRMRKAQHMMQTFGAQGVPTLIISNDKGSRLLRSNALYSSFDGLLKDIAAA